MTNTVGGVDRNYLRELRSVFTDPKLYFLDAGGSKDGLDELRRAGVEYFHASTDTQILSATQEIMSEMVRRLEDGHNPKDRFLVVIVNNTDLQDVESAAILRGATAWISAQNHRNVRLCWHRTSPLALAPKKSKNKSTTNNRSRATTR